MNADTQQPNPNYKEPEHGEIVGAGLTDTERFLLVYDADIKLVRKYVNTDTEEDDKKELARLGRIEEHIKANEFWEG